MHKSFFNVLFKQHKATVFFTACSIAAYLLLAFLRNEWYADFYACIGKKSNIAFSLVYFLILAALITANDSLKEWIKAKFIIKRRQEKIDTTTISALDIAQRITEDRKMHADHFFNFLSNILTGLGRICIFTPKLFHMVGSTGLMSIGILLAHASFIFLMNFGYLKKLIQFNLYNFEEVESQFRKFLSTIFNARALSPLFISKHMLTKTENTMRSYYRTNIFFQIIHSLYENIGLILPFAMFYSIYCANKIDFGQFMQLINLWTHLNFAVISIATGIEEYIKADTAWRRLDIRSTERNFGKNLELENISIFVKNKRIINNFSLSLKPNEQINIIAPNHSGKTTLMQAMQGYRQHDGTVITPENTLWIPEQVILPEKMMMPDIITHSQDKFAEACKIMNINPNIMLEKASGAEKWKLIASYAMLFDCVIWDDPFWGLDAQDNLEKLLPHLKTVVIFSATPVNGMKRVRLE